MIYIKSSRAIQWKRGKVFSLNNARSTEYPFGGGGGGTSPLYSVPKNELKVDCRLKCKTVKLPGENL